MRHVCWFLLTTTAFIYFPVTLFDLIDCLHHIHGQSPCIPCDWGIFTVFCFSLVQVGCKEE